MPSRVGDELRQRRFGQMARERPRGFVRGVEHHAVEPGSGAARDEREIRRAVGEQHGDEADAVARGPAERRQRRRGVAGEDAELDDVDAGRRHRSHGGQHRRRRERQVADGGADRAASGDGVADRRDGRIGEPPQRALRRLLEIDDVGAAGEGALRFAGGAHARQQLGHRAPSAAASR